MAKIRITANEFPDIIVSFLFDKMLYPEEVLTGNENFNGLSETMELKGMKPILMRYYLDMDANQRMNYKKIKSVFDISMNSNSIISISPSKKEVEVKKKKSKLITKIIKKLLMASKINDKEALMLKEYIKEEIR